MKKLFCLFTVLVLSISLVACGVKNQSNANKSNANNSITNTPTNTKITYTKEFTYLPSYNGVKTTQFTPATAKAPLATAKYTVKNTKDTEVYQNYESILKKDGWTITQQKKYFSISAKKGTHIANVLIQKLGNDIELIILSK